MPVGIVNVVVPTSGDGPIASIAALVGSKTVTLTGRFNGVYELLASHDNVRFVPVLDFNSDGLESIKLTLPDAYASVRVRASANVVPGSNVSVAVSGILRPGENLFATLVAFLPGTGGVSAIVDTAALFPPTGFEGGSNFICVGGFAGTLLVEGSNDGIGFNPIGFFRGSEQQRTLLGGQPPLLEFSPLSTGENLRYLRATLQGQVSSTVVVTFGGVITTAVGGGTGLNVSSAQGRSAIENGTIASTEVILYEWSDAFTGLPALIGAQLNVITRVLPAPNAPTGIIRLYIGATNPGDTAGATLITTIPGIVSNVFVAATAPSAPIANPGGSVIIQVTGEVSAPGVGNTNELDVQSVVVNFN